MVIPTGLVIAALTLREGLAGHRARHAVLHRNRLHGRGCAQGDGLLILQALVGRGAAINGVDLEPLR